MADDAQKAGDTKKATELTNAGASENVVMCVSLSRFTAACGEVWSGTCGTRLSDGSCSVGMAASSSESTGSVRPL